jgi:hypothetical protein
VKATLPDSTSTLRLTAAFTRWPNLAGGELLQGAGQPVSIDDQGRARPSDSSIDLPTYLVIDLADRRTQAGPPGPTLVELRTFDSEPGLDYDSWETIEEAGAHFSGAPIAVLADAEDPVDTLSDALNEHARPGWHTMRVSARNLTTPADEDNTRIRIDVWPSATPGAIRRIKHQPATVPRSKAPTAVDVSTEWRRLMSALHRAGDQRVAVRDMAFQIRLNPHLHTVSEAARTLSPTLPGPLIEWFAIHAIYPPRHWSQVIPDYDPLTLDEALKVRDQLLRAWEPDTYPETAGEVAYTYIPAFLPVAERDGYLLIADLREGRKRGQIIEFDKVDADDTPTTWRSLPRLLNDLSVAIEYRQPFNRQHPRFDTGTLSWSQAST